MRIERNIKYKTKEVLLMAKSIYGENIFVGQVRRCIVSGQVHRHNTKLRIGDNV